MVNDLLTSITEQSSVVSYNEIVLESAINFIQTLN